MTKRHLAVDEAGRPLRMLITEEQVADISCAHELVEHLRTRTVIADKGCDSDAFANTIRACTCQGCHLATLESKDQASVQ